MARYFFDSIASGDLVEDEDGKDMKDVASVRRHALEALADMARDMIPKGLFTIAVQARMETAETIYSVELIVMSISC